MSDVTPAKWGLLLVGGAAFWLVFAGSILPLVILRVLLALIVPVAAGIGVVVAILAAPGLKDVQTPLIAGTVIATGWVATALVAEYQRARERDRLRRDTLRALRSEIFAVIEKLDHNPIESAAEQTRTSMRNGKADTPPYHPFSTTESPTTVFDAVSGNISALRPEVLEPITRFYAHYSDMAAYAVDFRSPEVAALALDRRLKMHEALTRQRRSTLIWALKAHDAIDRELKVQTPVPRSGENPDIHKGMEA